ncbi:MAG: DUF3417 domain-containing protein, partial [Fimbriimonadaceae bacterium]|nr:DUF3417 domain-containing protein [Fimbriimonadaceae bacterium]
MSRISIKTLGHPNLPIPPALAGLDELALNLRWTWDHATQELFRDIDPWAWGKKVAPIGIIQNQYRLNEISHDGVWQKRVSDLVADLHRYLAAEPEGPPTAYFCAEFGLHESFALYSGGLGILAGDHCKEASDLNLPFVAVGLFYRRGFFQQVVDSSGRQEHISPTLDPNLSPI